MTELEAIEKEVEKFNDWIKNELNRFNDTNEASQSLRVEKYDKGVRSYGVSYLEFLNRGSKPWGGDELTNTRILGYILQKSGWSDRKGINSYAAAHGIVTKGSKVYRGEKKGLKLEKKVEKLRQNILEILPFYAKERLLIQLNEICDNDNKIRKRFNRNI